MLLATWISTLLLGSVAFVAPKGHVRRARRPAERQTNPLQLIQSTHANDASAASNISHVIYSSNWAGAVWNTYPANSFYKVTGTFTVPTPSPPNGYAAVWVGIDGSTCPTAILQTGIDMQFENGVVTYDAWYEWYPDRSYYFDNIIIKSGDVIKLTVTAYSNTAGMAAIENLSNGQIVYQDLSYPLNPLCEVNAEWIVEDFSSGGALVPFCDFGTVAFHDAYAYLKDGSYVTPDGATEMGIMQFGRVLTSVKESPGAVTITYRKGL